MEKGISYMKSTNVCYKWKAWGIRELGTVYLHHFYLYFILEQEIFKTNLPCFENIDEIENILAKRCNILTAVFS
jgi:hypothetical protein